MNIIGKLNKIQTSISVTKDKHNDFGKYNYRSCEDIYEAVKPLLTENGCSLYITDTIKAVGDRVYVEATVTLINNDDPSEKIVNSSSAREADIKKGMDSAQITGSASSYARKYALAGLFLLDDNKDPDSMDNRDSGKPNTQLQRNLKALEYDVLSKENGKELMSKILKTYAVKSILNLTEEQYQDAYKRLHKSA